MSGALHINPTKRAKAALARVDKLAQDAQISHAHAAILLIEAAPAVRLFDVPCAADPRYGFSAEHQAVTLFGYESHPATPAPFTPGPDLKKRSHHKKKEAAQ